MSGYALSRESVVVLLPERILSYPHGSLEEVLRHELAHVLIARAAGQRPVPRWLNENSVRGRVLLVAQAQPKDGGGGALYVLLRRRR